MNVRRPMGVVNSFSMKIFFMIKWTQGFLVFVGQNVSLS